MSKLPTYTVLSLELALILATILFCLFFVKNKPRSSKAFAWGVLAGILACVCDGLSYVSFAPEFPTFLIHAIMGVDMVIGDVTLLCFTIYCYYFISERATLDKRLYTIPMYIICFCIALTLLYILQGRIYTVQDNNVTMIGTKPLISSIADFAFMLYQPAIALLKRKQIGLKAVLLLGAFGVLPFVTYFLAVAFDVADYSFIATATSLVIVYLLLQNNQNEERERHRRLVIQEAFDREAALNSDLQKQNDIIAGAGMGIWNISLMDGREPEMTVNGTMKELLGIMGSELTPHEIYHAWYDNIDRGALESVNSSVEKMIQEGSDENTYKWMHPQFGKRYVRCGGFSTKVPGGYLLRGYHYDVTEQVGNEKRLNQIISSLAYSYDYLAYLSLTDNSFFIIDNKIPDGEVFSRITDGNDARLALRYICEQRVSPEFREQMSRFTDLSTLNQRLRHSQAVVYQYKDIREEWFMWSYIAAGRNPDGTLRHVICAVRRIDEEKQAELRQQRIIDENIAATKFLQNMSHEIRTPLNTLFGFAQLLGFPDGTWTEEEKATYNKHILNSFNMLEMLIGDILDIADYEHGNYQMTISDTDVNTVCENAIMTAEYRKPGNVNMYFTTELPEGYSIQSDGRRIQQVLINFLTNACKHTTSGEIHLHCSSSEHPDKITFSVTDTGCGVPAEKADLIFKRFTKLNKFDQGSGLGLNICQMIADKLEGEVYLDKTYTNGARFVFVIDNK